MPAEFDAYRELLGIESTSRPPDHYTLLGLELFESDRQKIEAAATERMGRLQDMANSEYIDHSQRLLNELSAARRCLLNAVQKVAYDETLRTKAQRAKQSGGRTTKESKGAAKKQPWMVSGIVGGIVLVLLLLVFLLQGTGDNANLIIDWPLSEREGAILYIDAKSREIPPTDPIRINVAEGRHIVEFQRSGYRKIEQRVQITQAPLRMKLRWIADKK